MASRLLHQARPCQWHNSLNQRMSDQSTARNLEATADPQGTTVPAEQSNTTTSGTKAETQSTGRPSAGPASKREETHMEDFAAALESFTLETEPAPSEDNVIKGTVVKISATHVV